MVITLFEHKYKDDGYIVDVIIYKIPEDKHHPEGIKYSLVLIKDGKRILGYDNHERRGHHIHKGEKEIKYNFVDEWKLIEDFYDNVQKMIKGVIR